MIFENNPLWNTSGQMLRNINLAFTNGKIQLAKIWTGGWNKTKKKKKKKKSKITGNQILLITILDYKYKQIFSYNEQAIASHISDWLSIFFWATVATKWTSSNV